MLTVERLHALADQGSLRDVVHQPGVTCARCSIGGVETAAFATDPTQRGGALGPAACRAIAATVLAALRDRIAVVGVWHSAGARIDDGVAALDGMGQVFAATTAASGRVLQLSVVLGTTAGGGAYGAALSDVVITAPEARLFVTGPRVVREVTGQQVDAADLGGPHVHSRRSGLVHLAADDAAAALQAARDLVVLTAGADLPAKCDLVPDHEMAALLPDRSRRAYDIRAMVARLLDDGRCVELHKTWAPNIVTTLGALGGRTVGVLANNPIRLGGCLDGTASDKAARFVRLCDGLGVALVVLVDVPGYLPGLQQEWDGVLRRGAKLLHAFAAASVPRVTVHIRKAYGGAYIAMNSRSLGASCVLAWPTAEIDVMGAEAAAQVMHRRELEGVAEARRAERLAELVEAAPVRDGLQDALRAGLVDRVIEPERTRIELQTTLEALPAGRGSHGNIPL